MNNTGKFYGAEIKQSSYQKDVVNGYVSVNDFKGETNTPVYECSKSTPVKLDNTGYYAIKVKVIFIYYFNDYKSKSTTIDKLSLSGTYGFSVKVDDDVINNPLTTEWLMCYSALIRMAYSEMLTLISENGVIEGLFTMPTDDKLIVLTKSLAISSLN